MAKSFLSATANYESLVNIKSGEINYYVQKNNESNLRKVFNFFQGDSKLLLINGFAGTGKKQVAEHILSFLDNDVIVVRFVCTEVSTLDDLHLAFLDTIKRKLQASDYAKCEAIESVKEKIDYLQKELNFRFVLSLFNFDLLTDDNKNYIQRYIYEKLNFDTCKALVVSKIFNTDEIPASTDYTKIVIKALSKEIFEEYIKEFGIRVTNSGIDQLYRLTRGYFLYACLSSKIIVNREMTINDFIVQYSSSGVKFDDFLANAYYRLIVGSTKSVFNIAVQLKHGFNYKMLSTFGSYSENILKTLLENYYLFRKSTLYYPSNFLKNSLAESCNKELKDDFLLDYYRRQSELSINLRDFSVSRATLNSLMTVTEAGEVDVVEDVKPVETVTVPQSEVARKSPDISEYEPLSSMELLSKAQDFYNKYEYRIVFDILFVLIDRKDDLKDRNLYKSVYILIAKTYTKLKRWKYALHYYSILADFVKNESEDEYNNIRYEMAVLYFESFQKSKAIQILTDLIKVSNSSNLLMACYIELGNIALYSGDKEFALSYYKKGIPYVTPSADTTSVIELYFKYASLSDEKNDITNAVVFYKKCFEMGVDSNKYTPLAYSNLGELFVENSLLKEAYDCFVKAVEIYKTYKNDFGMYYCLSKLYDLTDIKEKQIRLDLAKQMKEHALLTEDRYSILDSTLKLGDSFLDNSMINESLAEYLFIYNDKSYDLDEYNKKMLDVRMQDIKARLGKEKFDELVPNYV